MCQISGQGNVSCKIQKSYWRFQIKSFVFVVLIGAKGYCRHIFLTRVLLVTAILTNALSC